MIHHVIPALIDEIPEVVVIAATSKDNPCPVDNKAKYIIDTGKLCASCGVEIIVISGLIHRRNGKYGKENCKQYVERIMFGEWILLY